MPDQPLSRRAATAVTSSARQMLRPARLLIAGKTALAATLAWVLGGLLPGELGQFSYYAPLGAIIGIAPSLTSSLKSSVQTLVALALGVGVAWALIMSPAPAWVAVPLAVGFGTVLAGYGGLGAGRDYVPIAAMLVIVVGGRDAEDFSWGYMVQMGFGALLGVAVNLLVVPPLREDDAGSAVGGQRRRIAGVLRDMAGALDAEGDAPDWETSLAEAQRRTDEVSDAVRDARETRRANPRARFSRYDFDEDVDDLRVLGRASRHLGALGDVLRGGGGEPALLTEAGRDARHTVAEAMRASAELIDEWDGAQHGSGRPGKGQGIERPHTDPAMRLPAVGASVDETTGGGADSGTAGGDAAEPARLDALREVLARIRPGVDGDPFEPLATARYVLRSLAEDVDERMRAS